MFIDLFLASTLFCVGAMVFGHFESGTPLPRRLAKLFTFLGITALIAGTAGRPWSLIWIIGMFAVGLTFHVWWTRKNGIDVFTAEPRERYYALRGWNK
jgi:predicted membrane channel-forming protein YqfA (hemolysin III family)